MPVYNSQEFIAETVNSVIAQSYKYFELIIVDDSSTDSSVELLLTFKDERIQIIKLEHNSGGPAKPRNVGMDVAKGEFIAFLDSDDIWHPEKLKCQIDVILKNNLQFICSKKKKFKKTSEIFFKEIDDTSNFEKISLGKLLCKNHIPNSSVVLSRDIISNLRFDESKEYVAIEDYIFWLSVLDRTGIIAGKLDCVLLYYRVSDAGISNSKVKMFFKILNFYNNYKFENTRIGVKKYFYYLTYIYYSLLSKN